MLPHYCSAFIEQSLMLNRRRNEQDYLERELKEHFEELEMLDGAGAFGMNSFSCI